MTCTYIDMYLIYYSTRCITIRVHVRNEVRVVNNLHLLTHCTTTPVSTDHRYILTCTVHKNQYKLQLNQHSQYHFLAPPSRSSSFPKFFPQVSQQVFLILPHDVPTFFPTHSIFFKSPSSANSQLQNSFFLESPSITTYSYSSSSRQNHRPLAGFKAEEALVKPSETFANANPKPSMLTHKVPALTERNNQGPRRLKDGFNDQQRKP